MICKHTSNSTSSKAFDLKLKSDTVAPIQRITALHDYSTRSYLIVEQDDLFYLTEVKAVDQNNDIGVSFFSPPLPGKRFIITMSLPVQVSAANILAKVRDPPRKTKTNTVSLSNELFLSIQDLLDEFQQDF